MIWNLIGTIGGKVLDIGAANVTERSQSQYTSGQLVYYFRVLSDECELVSVWHECGDIMQHKVDATRREQRCVEV